MSEHLNSDIKTTRYVMTHEEKSKYPDVMFADDYFDYLIELRPDLKDQINHLREQWMKNTRNEYERQFYKSGVESYCEMYSDTDKEDFKSVPLFIHCYYLLYLTQNWSMPSSIDSTIKKLQNASLEPPKKETSEKLDDETLKPIQTGKFNESGDFVITKGIITESLWEKLKETVLLVPFFLRLDDQHKPITKLIYVSPENIARLKQKELYMEMIYMDGDKYVPSEPIIFTEDAINTYTLGKCTVTIDVIDDTHVITKEMMLPAAIAKEMFPE